MPMTPATCGARGVAESQLNPRHVVLNTVASPTPRPKSSLLQQEQQRVVLTVHYARTMKICTFALLASLAAPFASSQSLAPSAAAPLESLVPSAAVPLESLAPSSASSVFESLVPTDESDCSDLSRACTDKPCCEGLTCSEPFGDGVRYCALTRRLRGSEQRAPTEE